MFRDQRQTSPASTAAIVGRYRCPDDVFKKAPELAEPVKMLDWMVGEEKYSDAITFVSHWMSLPQVIWWATLCIWERDRQRVDESLEQTIEHVVGWLQNPTDKQRRMVKEAGDSIDKREPAAMLCKAVFFSGGNISKPNLPAVNPPKFLYATFVAGAIHVVVAKSPPTEYASRSKQVLRYGMEVLQGVNLWYRKAS